MKFEQLLYILTSLLLRVAFVTSQSCNTTGSVRLVNGNYYTEGRLEICHDGLWYTVCADNTYCSTVATVVCRQLGLSTTGVQVYGRALYEEGTGPVGFQNLSCSGTENNITQCNYTSLTSPCPHSMDAGVHCNPTAVCLDVGGHIGCCDVHNCYISFPYNCWCDEQCRQLGDCCQGIDVTCPLHDDSDYSEDEENHNNETLIVGSTPCSSIGAIGFDDGGETIGRLVVCDTDYRWKTICSVGFDEREARVICGSLGLSTDNVTIYNNTEYGQGFENVLPKSLQCVGNESRLTDCAYHNICCSHHLDVGIACKSSCTTGDLRLVGGQGVYDGRLEVCFEGRWGTVCDSEWDIFDARIACKTMNLPWKGAVAYLGSHTSTHYGQATSNITIWLEHVSCDGTEDNFWECFDEGDIDNVGSNCRHINDASLLCGPCDLAGYGDRCCDPATDGNCQGVTNETVCHCSLDCEEHNDCCIDFSVGCRCNDYDLRLRDGTVPNEGRVEICYNGEWGTVCDDYWDTNNAKVVCKQLGYSTTGATPLNYAYFGYGTGDILLDNVHCTGTETRLIDCPANMLGDHNCGHYEDASVRCVLSGVPCTHGQARLVRGLSDREGQLEVCYDGVWGTVCDDWFGQPDAIVACKTIFPLSSSVHQLIQYSSEYFGDSTLPIVMDNVQCSGSETNIVNCEHLTNHNCAHYEDIGLSCYPSPLYNGVPMLLPGPSTGRLLVYTGSTWGTICQQGFDIEDARVVCRELGQPTGSPRIYDALQFGQGFGSVKYTRVSCTGNETHLANCSKQTPSYYNYYCTHDNDIGIGCEEACADGQIRLMGGANYTEGRVEICHNGSWGTICDHDSSWGEEEAVVICSQLGYPYTAAQASSYNEFGPGSGPFHYDDIYCEGDEINFSQCNKSTIITCTTHEQDVGVICIGVCTPGDVRLVDGTGSNSGRLEICIGGYWGTVCGNSFNNLDASIVCKQLGLPHEGAEARYEATFGEGNDHIAISYVFCHGHEDRLFSCLFQIGSAVDCTHDNDVGVVCEGLCQNGDLKLVNQDIVQGNGVIVNEGRIEVCYNGVWGTICERGWDTYDARVACTQLGFNASSVRTFGGAKYPPGTGPIYYKDMKCIGNETSLIYCPANISTAIGGECSHSNDAGLICSGGLLPPNVTQDYNPPLPVPAQVKLSNVSTLNHTSVTISWSSPSLNEQSVITGYHISINTRNITVVGNTYSAVITGLSPGIPYTYEITAGNLFGTGLDYRSGIFFTAQLKPNSTVNDLTGIRITEYIFSISWTPLSLTQARGYITGYTIQWTSYNNRSLTNSTIVPPNITTYTTGPILLPSLKYNVSVSASTVAGSGPSSYPSLIIDTTSSLYLQFKLSLLENELCPFWKNSNSNSKIYDIVNGINQSISSQCQNENCQNFGLDHFSNTTLTCTGTDNTSVLFGVSIFAPSPLTNLTLSAYIQQWLNNDNTVLIVDRIEYRVCSSKTSTVVFCHVTSVGTVHQINLSVVIGSGAGGGVLFVLVILIILVILVVYLWRRRAGHCNIPHNSEKPPKNDVTVKYDAQKSDDKQILVQL